MKYCTRLATIVVPRVRTPGNPAGRSVYLYHNPAVECHPTRPALPHGTLSALPCRGRRRHTGQAFPMPGRIMEPPPSPAREANPWSTPLRDLGLKIGGTPLEPVLNEFLDELQQRGITRVRPGFYLSTEWGVPFGSVSIAIPFYLARPT